MTAEASGTSECPICKGTEPHAHIANEIEAWLSSQVAAWGYAARVFPREQIAERDRNCGVCSSVHVLARANYQWCRNCGALRVGDHGWAQHDANPDKSDNARFYEESIALDKAAGEAAIPQPAEVVGPAWRDKPDAEGWWLSRTATGSCVWFQAADEAHGLIYTPEDLTRLPFVARWFGPVRIPEESK
jgi:hypothetical protein